MTIKRRMINFDRKKSKRGQNSKIKSIEKMIPNKKNNNKKNKDQIQWINQDKKFHDKKKGTLPYIVAFIKLKTF